jgi:hypothetical protein
MNSRLSNRLPRTLLRAPLSRKPFCLANSGAPPPAYFEVRDGPVIGPKQ